MINSVNNTSGIQITSGSNNYSSSGISAILGDKNNSIGGQSIGGGSIGGIPMNGGSMTGAIMSEMIDSRIKEEFVFTLPDGSTRSYIVENNNIVQNDLLHADLGIGIISSLAWKDDWLVSGDTLGTIHCWNLLTKKSTYFVRICF